MYVLMKTNFIFPMDKKVAEEDPVGAKINC